tara:strand:- start:1287 stop:2018 length:732 start_codon:yes stop_codon:yes gene_type:complete
MKGIFENVDQAYELLSQSLEKARLEESNLSDGTEIANFILKMFGMSGKKWRHFLNNLASIDNVRYAEVGSHTGSTLCAAIYKNTNIQKISTLDNWSQFSDENTKNALIQNVSATASMSGYDEEKIDSTISLFEGDFNVFDFSELKPIDIYFFDGPHKEEDQYNGIVKAHDSLADIAIILVDDWNWGGPKRGTNKALKTLGLTVHHRCEIFTYPETYDSKTGAINRFQNSDWHNGVAMFIVSKK